MKIGILNIQGAITEHQNVCIRNRIDTVLINKPEDFTGIDGLILPGGESTVMRKLIDSNLDFKQALYGFALSSPIYATCAGSILLSNEYLGILDISVVRNGFGSQIASEVTSIKWNDIKQQAAFIRAPILIQKKNTQFKTEVHLRGQLVGVETEKIIAVSFHPELTLDDQLFFKFIDKCKQQKEDN